jgi:putative glutamine amidotransferase
MKLKKKPIIGISTQRRVINSPGQKNLDIVAVSKSYIDILVKAGGLPLLIPSTIFPEDATLFIDKLDGILLTGGQDVHPSCYNQKLQVEYLPNLVDKGRSYKRLIDISPDINRDKLEIAFYLAAKSKQLPVLGICRGMQIINVAEGGTLLQELDEERIMQHYCDTDFFHNISIRKNSMLYKLWDLDEYFTNSLHHQTIDVLGKDLVIVGKAKDGVVEIIESRNREHFVIGIQGHPEKTMDKFDKYMLIFEEFIQQTHK